MSFTSTLRQAGLLGRFALGLPFYLARPVDRHLAREHLHAGLATRRQRFLTMLSRVVFAYPDSPYRKLLQHAGIGEADIRGLVADHGLEGALERLYDAGVHVRLDEFKGRAPIRRGSLTLSVTPHDFDNPGARPHLLMSSGGSRSSGTRIRLDLEHYRQDTLYDALFVDAFHLAGRPYAIWRPVPPWGAGLKGALSHAKQGLRVERWFSQRPVGFGPSSWPHGLVTGYIAIVSRLVGGAVPMPEHVPLEEAATVAGWAAGHVARGRPALINTNAASAVRVCLAAKEAGLDMSGTQFRVGGEPLTAGKAAAITAAGARVVCHYTMSEIGRIGVACARPAAIDDVHILEDKLALIRRPPRGAGANGVLTNVYTTLTPAVPKLMLNVESDDYGTVERRSCGCPLDEAGLGLHLHTIRSWEKLTSEGMTLGGADLIRLVEETLPRHFGGGATDWQLVEEEVNGLPKVRIVASPRLGPLDTQAVLATALNELDAPSGVRTAWGNAGARPGHSAWNAASPTPQALRRCWRYTYSAARVECDPSELEQLVPEQPLPLPGAAVAPSTYRSPPIRCHRRQPPRRAVITGASSGIGSAFACELAGTTDLLLTGRDAIALEALASELRSGGAGARQIRVVTADPAIPSERAELICAADSFAPNLLENDAGIGTWGQVPRRAGRPPRIEDPGRRARTGHAGPRPAIGDGRARQVRNRGGTASWLVDLSCTLAFTPVPQGSISRAAKALVLYFTEALAAELTADPIDVLVVCPGPVRTDFFRRAGFPGSPPPLASMPARVARQALHDLGRRTVRFSDLPSAMPLRPVACVRAGMSRSLAMGLNRVRAWRGRVAPEPESRVGGLPGED